MIDDMHFAPEEEQKRHDDERAPADHVQYILDHRHHATTDLQMPLAARANYLELCSEVVHLRREYRELVDALCSPAWLPRNNHASVLGLARRLRDRQLQIIAMDTPKLCSRRGKHIGPCNGFPRNTCPGAQS